MNKLLAAGAVVAALGLGPQALADPVVGFSLSGSGISANGWLSFTPDPIATVVVPVGDVSGDPIGANNITGVGGFFSDANLGISNVAITGFVATVPDPGNAPFATSLSRLSVPGGTLPELDSNALTYSNLFYPGGAPDTCNDGLLGGYLDVFGMLLTLNNGDDVEVWSDSGGPNNSAIYGIAVAGPVSVDETEVETALDYIGGGLTMTVPEPASILLLGTAMLGALGFSQRSRDNRRAALAPG
jgi:hypothetical protein